MEKLCMAVNPFSDARLSSIATTRSKIEQRPEVPSVVRSVLRGVAAREEIARRELQQHVLHIEDGHVHVVGELGAHRLIEVVHNRRCDAVLAARMHQPPAFARRRQLVGSLATPTHAGGSNQRQPSSN
eukprot:3833064-Pleurochrysis_carterae.AAC.6